MSDNIRRVSATLGFTGPMDQRPRFHANDTSLDVMNVVPGLVSIEDARSWRSTPSLDVEGFRLLPHKSAVRNFRQTDEVEKTHPAEIKQLLLEITGADDVLVTGRPILRFGERSKDSGALDNSRPARFVHIDVSDATAQSSFKRIESQNSRKVARFAQYNVWRAWSAPPQDVPLAVCDARSIASADLVPADAVFDRGGEILFSFEGLLLKHNPLQRWVYFCNMRDDEVLVFKTNDTDSSRAHCVAHGAFDDPSCPIDVGPRCSVEMRGTAVWYE
jgi:hypothetical protein